MNDKAKVARPVKCPVCGADLLESDETGALRAERDCLAERLRAAPDMREVLSELRYCLDKLNNDAPETAKMYLKALLRRLDMESQ